MSKYRHSSMYCYPDSDVLINKFNLMDEEKLKELETVYTLFRLSELKINKPADPLDREAFLDIHRSILKDVYPFAGELRQEMISKGLLRSPIQSLLNRSCTRFLKNWRKRTT
nr:hypothetical protein [Planococcus glaciei]